MAKLTRLFNYMTNKTAIIHPYNATYRVLDGDNKELFYSDYSNALASLLAQGYKIDFIDNNEATRG